MVIARLIFALLMAFIVGWVMSSIFKENIQQISKTYKAQERKNLIGLRELWLLLLITASLLIPNYFVQRGPYLRKVCIWGIITLFIILYVILFIDRRKLKDWLKEHGGL